MAEIFHALMDGKRLLPIIDVTNPAFVVSATETELAQMSEQHRREQEQWSKLSPEQWKAIGNSTFGQALMKARGSYLPGLITYQMKLGPDNLGAEMQEIDRSIAASFPVFCARMRVQDMSRLMADGLTDQLNARPGQRLILINIADGVAADSWNALILLRQEHPDLLAGREITLAVLDLDDAGPQFGERAAGALCAQGAPLNGLSIAYRMIRYDWSETGTLAEVLADLRASSSLCGISSEGGLFEYGADEDILANLRTLHAGTATGAIVAGSVTRLSSTPSETQTDGHVATRPRSIAEFRSLAKEARWDVEELIERPFSFHVRLLRG